MINIANIHGREILDSRGNPTVEAEVTLVTVRTGRAGVPSGASTGTREAVELRDGDAGAAISARACKLPSANVNGVIGMRCYWTDSQGSACARSAMIDLDGSANKGKRLGANALLAVSLAAAKAQALIRAGRRCSGIWVMHDHAGANDEYHQRWRPCR